MDLGRVTERRWGSGRGTRGRLWGGARDREGCGGVRGGIVVVGSPVLALFDVFADEGGYAFTLRGDREGGGGV